MGIMEINSLARERYQIGLHSQANQITIISDTFTMQ